MWKAADMFRPRLALFFPDLVWWRRTECKWESRVKFLCAQTPKKITFSTLFGSLLPLFFGAVTWKLHIEPQSGWKDWVCSCENCGGVCARVHAGRFIALSWCLQFNGTFQARAGFWSFNALSKYPAAENGYQNESGKRRKPDCPWLIINGFNLTH